MRKSCFPREGSGWAKRVLALSMSALLTGSSLSRRDFLGFFGPKPRLGVGGRDSRSRVPRVPPDPGHLKPRKMPGLAQLVGRILSPASSLLPRPSGPARPRRVFELAKGGGEGGRGEKRGRGGGTGERAPKLQTAQLQLQVSGPSLEAIINLRFIFIGELESRLTLAKQGSSSRPWMRLNAGEYFCRKALQARLL